MGISTPHLGVKEFEGNVYQDIEVEVCIKGQAGRIHDITLVCDIIRDDGVFIIQSVKATFLKKCGVTKYIGENFENCKFSDYHLDRIWDYLSRLDDVDFISILEMYFDRETLFA